MNEQDTQTTELQKDNDRRDFIRNSALAAGAVATVGMASSVSADVCETAVTDKPKVLSANFDARYQDKITREDINLVMDRLFEIAGCPACGLNGFDFNLNVSPVFDIKSNIPVNVGINY